MTADPDLNLLRALDALLAEGSVTAAARRLGLSASAMSRTLARLRTATGDPLLVRAGRDLVPTPRAVALGERVRGVLREASGVLAPQDERLDLLALERTFTVRASEAFLEMLAAPVAAAVGRAAPLACLRFVAKPDRDPRPLRDGSADLEIGLLATAAPELRTRLLFHDRLVGVAREGHPVLGGGTPDAAGFAACAHVAASKEARASLSIDVALARAGLRRAVRVMVPGYPDAMRIVRASDLIGVVPHSCLGNRLLAVAPGLVSFELPVTLPPFRIAAMWHPRLDADPAQRWLRQTIAAVCRDAYR